MSVYPVSYEIPYQERQSRLKAFFRMILVIPLVIFLLVYGIVAEIFLVVSWFVLLFTAKYPDGLYNFVAGYLRLAARVNTYHYLLTDKYPPFSGSAEAGDFPLEIKIGPAKESYSRLKVLFRPILAIPMLILAYLISIWLGVMALVAWVVEVITGKLPLGIYNQLTFCNRYLVRAASYFFLITEVYPPVSDEEPV